MSQHFQKIVKSCINGVVLFVCLFFECRSDLFNTFFDLDHCVSVDCNSFERMEIRSQVRFRPAWLVFLFHDRCVHVRIERVRLLQSTRMHQSTLKQKKMARN